MRIEAAAFVAAFRSWNASAQDLIESHKFELSPKRIAVVWQHDRERMRKTRNEHEKLTTGAKAAIWIRGLAGTSELVPFPHRLPKDFFRSL
jgi:hypothetical protein